MHTCYDHVCRIHPLTQGLTFARRCSATVALLASAPAPAGAALVGQAFSPHLDLHQRLFVLESLSAGARALSHAPADPTNPGTLQSLERPCGAAPASGGSGRAAGEAGGGVNVNGGAGGGRQVGVSRRWGVRALAKLQAPPARTRRNRSAAELGVRVRCGLARKLLPAAGPHAWAYRHFQGT